MVRPRILVVDDERDIRELLRMAFEARGWQVREAGDLSTAYRLLRGHETDLCITDMRLPDGNGIELVEAMSGEQPNLPVIVITAYGSIDTAVHALQAGAFDFVSKPINTDILRAIVQHALQRNPDNERSPSALIGDSSAMAALRDAVGRVAGNQAPVAITGESGTGKQLVAREIHRLASPVERPFITVNCAALPEERMIEAFFGGGGAEAVTPHREGLLRAAGGGTLYLDDAESLPAFMQARLLDALHERRIVAPDGTRGDVFDARVISSSAGGLQQAVQAGRLRHDLFYRLNVIELRVPTLRDRPEDLPLLVGLIHGAIQRRWGRPAPTLSAEALARLQRHPFPGNYGELENLIERAAALAGGDTIEIGDLQFIEVPLATDERKADVSSEVTGDDDLPGRLAADERAAILAALEKTHWNRTAAARLLGLSFRQLRYRIKKFGLEDASG